MLLALLFIPALVAIALVLVRRPVRVLEEVAVAPSAISGAVSPIATLDALLAELEGASLDNNSVVQLERLADKLEAAAASLERVG
jgi:Tfp pilus assembly protein PilN